MMRFVRNTSRFSWIQALCVLLVFGSLTSTASAEWMTDFAAAKSLAEREQRLLVVHFFTTWCGPCQQMERTVLHNPALMQKLGKSFVAVKVDGDRHPELISQFRIQAYPSDVILDSTGRVVSQTAGYQDRNAYIAQLTQLEDRYSRPRAELAKRSADPDSDDYRPSLRRAARTLSKAADESKVSLDAPQVDEAIVGLDGYSPVALAQHRRWNKGRPEYSGEYQGVLYYLSDAEEQRLFLKDPSRYAPRLLGCDAIVLWKSDEALPGSTRFGAFFDGELFLFASQENRTTFKQDPLKYTRARHVLQVDAIDPTRIR